MTSRRVLVLALLTQSLLIATAWTASRLLHIPPQWGNPPRDVVIGLAGAAVLACCNYALLVRAPANWLVDGVRAVYDDVLVPLFSRFDALSAITVGVAAGIGEEWLFRGVVQPIGGLIIASVLFGFAHVGGRNMVPFGVWACCMGLALGALAHLTGGLTAPIVAHGVYDILALAYIRRGGTRRVTRSFQGITLAVAFGVLVLSVPAFAQQRPLVTEDPEVIGAGRVLIEGGLDLERDVLYPLSGLRGDRLSVATFGINVGLSSIAEVELDGGVYQRLNIKERRAAPLAGVVTAPGDRTSDIEDLILATKIRLFGETTGRPAVGLRFATKLPNASNEGGLGTDMTDFFASLLIAKTIQSIRVVGNGGIAILGDATADTPAQHDLLTFGLSVARALTTSTELVGEVNGRVNFADGDRQPGGENRAVMRLGGRYTRGTVRLDAALLLGITPRDPQVGVTGGFTWVFDAFRTP